MKRTDVKILDWSKVCIDYPGIQKKLNARNLVRYFVTRSPKSSSKYTRLIEETPDELDRKLYKRNQSLWKSYSDNYEEKFCYQYKSKSEKNNYPKNNASISTHNKTNTSEKTDCKEKTNLIKL